LLPGRPRSFAYDFGMGTPSWWKDFHGRRGAIWKKVSHELV
jgi:hypothetical protein